MSSSVVFDASALLVLLNKEPGYLVVEKHLSSSVMSTVNVSEVMTILTSIGIMQTDARSYVLELISEIVPFNFDHAACAAELRNLTKPYGLSLGDRSCLALAFQLQSPVLTADQIWKEIKFPFEVWLVR